MTRPSPQVESNNEERLHELRRPTAAHFDSNSGRPAPPSIELSIDELVLHGFEPAQRYAIGEALQHELTRLLIQQGRPSAISEAIEIEHLNAGSINVVRSDVKATGRAIARAVYGELDR